MRLSFLFGGSNAPTTFVRSRRPANPLTITALANFVFKLITVLLVFFAVTLVVRDPGLLGY